jgi:hypothetical protein
LEPALKARAFIQEDSVSDAAEELDLGIRWCRGMASAELQTEQNQWGWSPGRDTVGGFYLL